MSATLAPPPLGVYVHIPWCVKKCPYCDFNSHRRPDALPQQAYVDALLRDLKLEAPRVAGRQVHSIFFGGGTPSLLSAHSVAQILDGLAQQLSLASTAEITLEANPGTLEQGRFAAYRKAGINRLSIGVQSLNDQQLQALGRIHNAADARRAAQSARAAGFDNFNLDLMYALPEQSLEQAKADLQALIALAPTHISYYQLTLEPGTPFHTHPPALPNDETAWAMQEQGQALLSQAGYAQYEVSAYAQAGHPCQHNLNYWRFGDYLGLGAGAHGKITDPAGAIWRTEKPRFPNAYMHSAGQAAQYQRNAVVEPQQLPFEFMLGALRLPAGVESHLFHERTGLSRQHIASTLNTLTTQGLLQSSDTRLATTALGYRYLNRVIGEFLEGAVHT